MRPPRRLTRAEQEQAKFIAKHKAWQLTQQYRTQLRDGSFIYRDLKMVDNMQEMASWLPNTQQILDQLSDPNDPGYRDDRDAFDGRMVTLDFYTRLLQDTRRTLPPATWWNFGIIYDWIASMEAQIAQINDFLFQPIKARRLRTRSNRGAGYLWERTRFRDTENAMDRTRYERRKDIIQRIRNNNVRRRIATYVGPLTG